MSKYICGSCGESIKKRQRYCLHMELFAAPEVELDAEDIRQDLREEMQRIWERVKNVDSKKLEEDVYICYDLTLCKKCRDIFVQRIKCKEFI